MKNENTRVFKITKFRVIVYWMAFVVGVAMLFFATDYFKKANMMIWVLILGGFLACLKISSSYFKNKAA